MTRKWLEAAILAYIIAAVSLPSILPNGIVQPDQHGAIRGNFVTHSSRGTIQFSRSKSNLESQLLYQVSFQEIGLLPDTNWSVTLNGSTQNLTNQTIDFFEPNGNYSYMFGEVPGFTPTNQTGDVVVMDAPVVVYVYWNAPTYEVQFYGTGLPSNLTWWINITDVIQQQSFGSGRTDMFLPNGTYAYSIASGGELYQPFPSTGSFEVQGTTLLESVSFVLYTSSVTFVESGLSTGASWHVSAGPYEHSSSTSSIVFVLSNGSYSFEVGSSGDLVPSPPNGTFVVNASTRPLIVTFSMAAIYVVTFAEVNLSRGTNWSITLLGNYSGVILIASDITEPNVLTKWSEGAPTVLFDVSNGSYEYAAVASGYSSIVGSFTVVGHSPSPLVLDFPAHPTQPPPTGANSLLSDYVLIAIAAALAVIGVGAVAARGRSKRPVSLPPPQGQSIPKNREDQRSSPP
ncbi:MAG: hypothetical protein WAN87_09120 [Thermoplasmata archaeon]